MIDRRVYQLLICFFLQPVSSEELQARGIKSLKPVNGGHVYGESNFEYRSATNVDGHTQEQSGGHKVVNKDGVITEYDYKPSPL